MGIYDRQYYREEEGRRGYKMDRPRSIVAYLIIANVVVYVVNMFFSQNNALNDLLALQGDLFVKPINLLSSWQLFTHGFVHAPFDSRTGIMHILMNMYVLFLFGRDVENKCGRAEFLRLYVLLLIFCGIVWVIVQTAMSTTHHSAIGASGAVTGMMVLFCLNFPQRKLYLLGMVAIPAWVLGVAYVGFDIFGALGGGKDNVAYESHLAGAVMGFAYHRFGLNFGHLLPSRLLSVGKWLKAKPKLRVHQPDADDRYRDQDAEADRLLEKVHRQGEESLTAKERRLLEDYSRRMKQKRR